jgi:hypothetical protein
MFFLGFAQNSYRCSGTIFGGFDFLMIQTDPLGAVGKTLT